MSSFIYRYNVFPFPNALIFIPCLLRLRSISLWRFVSLRAFSYRAYLHSAHSPTALKEWKRRRKKMQVLKRPCIVWSGEGTLPSLKTGEIQESVEFFVGIPLPRCSAHPVDLAENVRSSPERKEGGSGDWEAAYTQRDSMSTSEYWPCMPCVSFFVRADPYGFPFITMQVTSPITFLQLSYTRCRSQPAL
jgi:hypothetical protein